MYMDLKRLFTTEMGKIAISIILGLGLASLFRRVCTSKNCIQFEGPVLSEFEDKILLHIPKCAGTSILTALKLDVWNGDNHYNPNYNVRIHYNNIQQTHIPAKDIKINKPRIAFVRNPWERTISRYWYCKKRYGITER